MLTVETYEQLGHYVRMFLTRRANLLILEGEGGLGKSAMVDEICKGQGTAILDSHLTPLSNYIELYKAKDAPIVYRDIDTLLANKINISLLKQVAETRPTKHVSYHSSAKVMQGLPATFETSSNVLIEANALQIANPNIQALITRGFHVLFLPSHEEVDNRMRKICQFVQADLTSDEKRETCEWLIDLRKRGQSAINLRHLVHAFGLFSYSKLAPSFDWKAELAKMIEVDYREAMVASLMTSGKNVAEQAQEFMTQTGSSRATFFRLKSRLK